MGVNIDSYAGWGLALDVETIGNFLDVEPNELIDLADDFGVAGFSCRVCGDYLRGLYTVLLITSDDNEQSRDFTPVYAWLHEHLEGSYCDDAPSIVGGFTRM